MTQTCGVSISGLWGVFLLAGSGGWAGTLAHYAGVMAIYLRMDSTERRIYFPLHFMRHGRGDCNDPV